MQFAVRLRVIESRELKEKEYRFNSDGYGGKALWRGTLSLSPSSEDCCESRGTVLVERGRCCSKSGSFCRPSLDCCLEECPRSAFDSDRRRIVCSRLRWILPPCLIPSRSVLPFQPDPCCHHRHTGSGLFRLSSLSITLAKEGVHRSTVEAGDRGRSCTRCSTPYCPGL